MKLFMDRLRTMNTVYESYSRSTYFSLHFINDCKAREMICLVASVSLFTLYF